MRDAVRETAAKSANGLAVLFILFLVLAGSLGLFASGVRNDELGRILGGVLGLMTALVCLAGLFMVEPNQGRVLTLFGAYRGSERRAGLRWANPFYGKR